VDSIKVNELVCVAKEWALSAAQAAGLAVQLETLEQIRKARESAEAEYGRRYDELDAKKRWLSGGALRSAEVYAKAEDEAGGLRARVVRAEGAMSALAGLQRMASAAAGTPDWRCDTISWGIACGFSDTAAGLAAVFTAGEYFAVIERARAAARAGAEEQLCEAGFSNA
jgi:hypothetical protein